MSWDRALRDAERWIQKIGLPKPLSGEHINLDDFAESLPYSGGYRIIVLGAAKRLLEKRGATVRFTTSNE